MVFSSCRLELLVLILPISLVLKKFIFLSFCQLVVVTLNSVANLSFSSIETFECESLTFSWEDDGPAVAIWKSFFSATITQLQLHDTIIKRYYIYSRVIY